MSFVEIQFPTDISYGAAGGPIFSTDVVTMFSGHEQRNSNWNNVEVDITLLQVLKLKLSGKHYSFRQSSSQVAAGQIERARRNL